MRLVIEHTKGPWAGMHQIVGEKTDLLLALNFTELPTILAMTNSEGIVTGASLVTAKRSYILYRELIEPAHANKHFNPAQR